MDWTVPMRYDIPILGKPFAGVKKQESRPARAVPGFGAKRGNGRVPALERPLAAKNIGLAVNVQRLVNDLSRAVDHATVAVCAAVQWEGEVAGRG